jgi:hypothetical protein
MPGGEDRIGTVRPLVSFDCDSSEKILEKILSEGKHWHTAAITLRKSILEQVGGFSERLTGVEDLVLWLKLACLAKLVNGSSNLVAVYRIHSQNYSTHGALNLSILPLLAYLEVCFVGKEKKDRQRKDRFIEVRNNA